MKIPRMAWEAIGIFVAMLLLLWGKTCYDSRIIANAQAKQAVDSGAVHIEKAKDTLRIRDSVVVRDVYQYHDVARAVIASHPNDTSVAHLVQACDQIVVSCADQRKASKAVIDSQDVQIKRLTTMKALSPPRLSFFGEVLRDFPNAEWQGRAGVNFRVVGPIELSGIVEAHPKDTKASALLGLRYTFR